MLNLSIFLLVSRNLSLNSFRCRSHLLVECNVSGPGPSFFLFSKSPSLSRSISSRISFSSAIHSGANPESISTLLSLRVVESTNITETKNTINYINRSGRRGGLVVSTLDSGSKGPGSSPGRVIVLCSCARHFTLTVPPSIQEYKWVPANFTSPEGHSRSK